MFKECLVTRAYLNDATHVRCKEREQSGNNAEADDKYLVQSRHLAVIEAMPEVRLQDGHITQFRNIKSHTFKKSSHSTAA